MILIFSSQSRFAIKKLHPDIRKGIQKTMDELKMNPYLGKPLVQELTGYFSLAYKRYRIIYEPRLAQKEIRVYHIGHRSVVYEEFLKLANQHRYEN